jgi:purine nucleoside phosphorylase
MPSLKNATKIDFTSSIDGFNHMKQFDQSVIDLIRANKDKKMVVIVDSGHELPSNSPHVVSDHLNLTGTNPLIGPTYEGGPRFPVINDVYVKVIDTLDPKKTMPLNNPLGSLPSGIVAGLKDGVVPTAADLKAMREMGADFYCYNLVPAMLVAGQIGLKVLGIVVPAGQKLDKDTAKTLKGD